MAVRARPCLHAQAVVTLGTEVFGPDSEMVGYFLGALANIQLHLAQDRRRAREQPQIARHLSSHQGPGHTRSLGSVCVC